jgi:hypothetical protein
MFFRLEIWGFSKFVLGLGSEYWLMFADWCRLRRGCATFVGRDVSKIKGKGGGKFKYMSEKDMLELAAKFAPYRYD